LLKRQSWDGEQALAAILASLTDLAWAMAPGAKHESIADSSWTPAAVEVFTRACEHYGGLETWRALRRIRLVPERLSGLVPFLKGVGRTFRLPWSAQL
jgi:hypothetical protein